MIPYKLTSCLFAAFSKFHKFVNEISSACLPCKYNNYTFADWHHVGVVTGELRILENHLFNKLLLKEQIIERLGL